MGGEERSLSRREQPLLLRVLSMRLFFRVSFVPRSYRALATGGWSALAALLRRLLQQRLQRLTLRQPTSQNANAASAAAVGEEALLRQQEIDAARRVEYEDFLKVRNEAACLAASAVAAKSKTRVSRAAKPDKTLWGHGGTALSLRPQVASQHKFTAYQVDNWISSSTFKAHFSVVEVRAKTRAEPFCFWQSNDALCGGSLRGEDPVDCVLLLQENGKRLLLSSHWRPAASSQASAAE